MTSLVMPDWLVVLAAVYFTITGFSELVSVLAEIHLWWCGKRVMLLKKKLAEWDARFAEVKEAKNRLWSDESSK